MFITILLGLLVVFVLIYQLYERVKKLERLMEGALFQNTSVSNSLAQSQQFVSQQSELSNQSAQSMSTDSLFSYVTQQLARGVEKEDIKSALLGNGWQLVDIERAFNDAVTGFSTSSSVGVINDTSSSSETLSQWLKEDWLLKLGVVLLLIGFGWLTTYAFLNNWIGPMGRIALGIVAGACFILLGWWRIGRYISQGGIFLVFGSTTILLTIFAARTFYDFFTPFSALAVMLLSVALVTLASVKYKSQVLSFLSLVLANIAPLLTGSSARDDVGLYAYLFIVLLGTIWVVALTGQRALTFVALVFVSFYSLFILESPSMADIEMLLLLAYAFAALFFVTNTIGILKSEKSGFFYFGTAILNGLFLIVWVTRAAQNEWQSLILVAWAIVFSVGAFLIFKITGRREPFYIYSGVSVAMLAAATAVELSGATLVIAYIIETITLLLVARVVLRDIRIIERMIFLLLGPIFLSLESIISPRWKTGVIHEDFFVLFLLAASLFFLGIFFLRFASGNDDKKSHQLGVFMMFVGSFFLYVLVWLSLHAGLVDDDIAVMIALVLYTIIGLLSYFYGLMNKKGVVRVYGGVLIGFVVGRLFLVDIWNMDLAGRIATFFLIGTLFISTAFFGRKR
ncbi:MAG: DUF2339 domain-containing protein [Candidatus Moranbacteria bacterium]|nr:DUF2339 domain-containing protein [Candidatus Moranbacteria bacterium]